MLVCGQNKYALNIKVKDSMRDEPISNLKIYVGNQFFLTDESGICRFLLEENKYQITIIKGEEEIFSSFITISKDTLLDFYYVPQYSFEAIRVVGKKNLVFVTSNRLSFSKSTIDNTLLPLSTNDPINLVKFLPGVNSTQEMNSSLSIRGSNSFNTCFYIDEMPVVNLSHSSGLFSFFDNKTLRGIDYMNNEVSSEFGMRGSSYIKFIAKEPSLNKKFANDITLNPFLISFNSDVSLKKDKLGFFVHYRKSLLSNEYNKTLPMFSNFSDFFIKVKYKIKKNSNFYLSAINGQDVNTSNLGFGLNINDSTKWRFQGVILNHEYFTKKGILLKTIVYFNKRVIKKINNINSNNEDLSEEFSFKHMIRNYVMKKYSGSYGIENTVFIQKNFSQKYPNTLLPGAEYQNMSSIFFDNKFKFMGFEPFWNGRLCKFSNIENFYLENKIGLSYRFESKIYQI